MLYNVGPGDPSPFYADVQKMSLQADGEELKELLIHCSYIGDNRAVGAILDKGIPVGTVEESTGMTALHYAVGRNNLPLTKVLVSRGAPFAPDKSGRWPTTIAGMCEASGDLCDFIVEAEAASLGIREDDPNV